MDLSYILNELGEERLKFSGSVAPPVFQSSNFQCRDVEEMRYRLSHEFEEPIYTRGNNPTVEILRKKLAALEHTEDALIFSSGSAAVAAAVLSQVNKGDHIVCVENPYGWTKNLLSSWLPRFGVETTFVPGTSIEQFEQALISRTRLIYLESPNSFTFSLQNIAQVANLARSHNITTIIDNSYSTPLYQNPADLGIDLVLHSASKYLGGHSDLVAGVVCGSQEKIKPMFQQEFMTLGAKLSPWDAWLILRGLRTLPIRLERIVNSTHEVTGFMQDHPLVDKFYYPFSSRHPQHALARKQMKAAPGLFTIALKVKDYRRVEDFVNQLQLFVIAVSWGGHESLVFPACASMDKNEAASSPNFNLIRFYVGLEDPKVLIEDLKQALDSIS